MLYVYIGFIDCLPQHSETGLGNIEYNTITGKIETASESGNKWNALKKYTSQECYKIGKYAAEHGNSHKSF